MQAAHTPIPRHLPGTSATRMQRGMALLFSAITLSMLVALLLLAPTWSSVHGWHLPWTVLQWALTTRIGNLALVALCLLVAGPPLVLGGRLGSRREIAQARDVTGLPLAEWPPYRLPGLEPPLALRWSELGRRERAVSVALLVLAVALMGAGCASLIVMVREPDFNVLCTDRYGCPPTLSTAWLPLVVSAVAAGALMLVAWSRGCKRVEASCGVWFRYPDWMTLRPVSYIRQPEVTPEAATAALARVFSARAYSLSRQLFVLVLMLSLGMVPYWVAFFLIVWLPYQWLPG